MTQSRYAIILAFIAFGFATALPASARDTALSEEEAVMFGAPPKDIDVRLAEAAKHPFGSQENPIRVDDPAGEYRYLARLRCQNQQMPVFDRVGNFGIGVYGHIVDGYNVECPGSEPLKSLIFMDMYFHNYVETRAPDGFTLVP